MENALETFSAFQLKWKAITHDGIHTAPVGGRRAVKAVPLIQQEGELARPNRHLVALCGVCMRACVRACVRVVCTCMCVCVRACMRVVCACVYMWCVCMRACVRACVCVWGGGGVCTLVYLLLPYASFYIMVCTWHVSKGEYKVLRRTDVHAQHKEVSIVNRNCYGSGVVLHVKRVISGDIIVADHGKGLEGGCEV